MDCLVAVKGPNPGQRFPLDGEDTLIGRQPDARVYLESLAVSRQHAHIVRHDASYAVEDLGSSNGTFLNGQRISRKMPLTDRDLLQMRPYVFALRAEQTSDGDDGEHVVRAQVNALTSNLTLYT